MTIHEKPPAEELPSLVGALIRKIALEAYARMDPLFHDKDPEDLIQDCWLHILGVYEDPERGFDPTRNTKLASWVGLRCKWHIGHMGAAYQAEMRREFDRRVDVPVEMIEATEEALAERKAQKEQYLRMIRETNLEPAEKEILRLMGNGWTAAEISAWAGTGHPREQVWIRSVRDKAKRRIKKRMKNVESRRQREENRRQRKMNGRTKLKNLAELKDFPRVLEALQETGIVTVSDLAKSTRKKDMLGGIDVNFRVLSKVMPILFRILEEWRKKKCRRN